MNFILFYILRKFFVHLEFSGKTLKLRNGLLLRRIHIIPKSSVTSITCRRSPFLRLFRAKEVTIFTLNGHFRIYLRRGEPVPFAAKPPRRYIKPNFRQIAFGAFIDVRALGAVAMFAAVLRRIGAIFGGKYLDNILRALDTVTENVERVFAAARIYVPWIAAALGVFALAAWTFAYFKRLASLLRFRVGFCGDCVIVTSGLFTLYEHTLVQYNAAAVRVDSFVSLIADKAPVYLRDIMICPCADRKGFEKLSRLIHGKDRAEKTAELRPPRRAIPGYCAVSLGWSAVFAALLAFIYLSELLRGAMLIKTALYSGLFVSLYSAALCLFYIKHSRLAFGERLCLVSARRSLRLYTAVFPKASIIEEKLSQSAFQRRSGLDNYKLSIFERKSFNVRQLPKGKLP